MCSRIGFVDATNSMDCLFICLASNVQPRGAPKARPSDRRPKAGGNREAQLRGRSLERRVSHRINPSRTSTTLCRIEGKEFAICRYLYWQYGRQRSKRRHSGLESIPVAETGVKQFGRHRPRRRRLKGAPCSLDLESLSSGEWWQSIRPLQA